MHIDIARGEGCLTPPHHHARRMQPAYDKFESAHAHIACGLFRRGGVFFAAVFRELLLHGGDPLLQHGVIFRQGRGQPFQADFGHVYLPAEQPEQCGGGIELPKLHLKIVLTYRHVGCGKPQAGQQRPRHIAHGSGQPRGRFYLSRDSRNKAIRVDGVGGHGQSRHHQQDKDYKHGQTAAQQGTFFRGGVFCAHSLKLAQTKLRNNRASVTATPDRSHLRCSRPDSSDTRRH